MPSAGPTQRQRIQEAEKRNLEFVLDHITDRLDEARRLVSSGDPRGAKKMISSLTQIVPWLLGTEAANRKAVASTGNVLKPAPSRPAWGGTSVKVGNKIVHVPFTKAGEEELAATAEGLLRPPGFGNDV